MGRWARKPVNHTSWVAVVTPTDRPKSVRNRCLIELFCGVVCVVTLPFWHFCCCRGFCHRIESDLFLFLWEAKLRKTLQSISVSYQNTLSPLKLISIYRSRFLSLVNYTHGCEKIDSDTKKNNIYSPKKVTHNILVNRQVQIIVAITCVLYISYVIE